MAINDCACKFLKILMFSFCNNSGVFMFHDSEFLVTAVYSCCLQKYAEQLVEPAYSLFAGPKFKYCVFGSKNISVDISKHKHGL